MVRFEYSEDTLLARLFGEIDLKVADSLRRELESALDRHSVNFLVFDLSAVSFLDSTGLGVILGRYKRVAEAGGKVAFIAPPPQVKRVLELAGVLRFCPLFSSWEEARVSLRGEACG
ncbi:STAS domain-containing protein [Ammonifex thiophilus]|uniref:Anti-sigma factor antagonist n=1 Tax=Ammonifex thiophilus TaxID=444093 RepID=A0A3D8P699_9THEO|nr:anti-sigma factor antagonist [Ammonifex thiophilus]RDV83454.1 STAS domain-containing protein [Ammonifex thiophilus]